MSRIKQISEHVRDHYAALLEAGQLVGVAVGGAEEALFDWDYNMLWANRNGFAKLALRTGAWHIVYTRKEWTFLKKQNIKQKYLNVFHCRLLSGKVNVVIQGAPIIPIFTENIREAFDTIPVGERGWRMIYRQSKDIMPFMPILGGLPVKLTTFVGDAITVTEDETPDQLKERVEVAMRQMIAKHHVQGGVGKALMERIKSLV